MTEIDWKAEMAALDASLPERLERLALMAETANHHIGDMRVIRRRGCRHHLRGAGRDPGAQGD